ncbi:Alcohol dehydrogenase-like, C-terminal [Dillenia turbinata]|uniref:Alcohol dehydrogenase 1 n=1 Tax=Dillenia turbinata TaxID=194707 RepID=A0AAN8VRV3_9MAGN
MSSNNTAGQVIRCKVKVLQSTFSEYTVVHVGCVAKVNPKAPLDKVCILSYGVSTGLSEEIFSNLGMASWCHFEHCKPKRGSSVAIFGLGAVGLAISHLKLLFFHAAEGARISGASRIIGVDLNPRRFEEAKKFGVTEFINPKDFEKPVQEVIAEMTDGGVRSIECTGSIAAMISAFGWVHNELQLEKFITHEVPFLEISKAFDYMLQGDSLRCIIRMEA